MKILFKQVKKNSELRTMSTNTNTDLTEEDAADLQFPKGLYVN